jgi:ubiquinone/menaquinone biosynthesis C-methylase UbiE
MLARAAARARSLRADLALVRGDVERLPFPDDSFDAVVATCVFCSVADPVAGLRELTRVVRDDGQILLVEHVRPRNPVLGLLADLVTPLTRRTMG